MKKEVLSDLRGKIDSLDQQILELINQRAEIAMEVAKRKMSAGEVTCFYRPEREAQVLQSIKAANQGPLSDDTVMRFFRELMSSCLALEKPLQIAYLGPEGTFTQQAAYKHFGQAVETFSLATIPDVFRDVSYDRCQFGVVPVENSTEGVVSHTLDQFINSSLQICGEVVLPIHHYLLSAASKLSEIREVVAHQQALAQCKNWLTRHLPDVCLTAVSSNAEAARISRENLSVAAIASEFAAKLYGLNVLQQNIEDEIENTTRFFVIGKQTVGQSQDDKTTLMISTGNRPGALHDVLAPLASHGISMTKIESRPSRQGNWNYVFFIEIEGHQNDPRVATALEALNQSVIACKVLGSYPRALLK